MSLRFLASVPLLFGLFVHSNAAHGAESYDNCTGFIDSLPTTISTQGVWCLRHDLATNITTGNAIEIATNNVTIDCNDFKLGGLAAGDASQTDGIVSTGQNTTIRHCNIRGFYRGVHLSGGGGHLVEENRLDNNLYYGILIESNGHNLVRHNRVFDTGGATGYVVTYGIAAEADIIENIIDGVFTDGFTDTEYGIVAWSHGAKVSDNTVVGLAVDSIIPIGPCYGIYLADDDQIVSGNRLVGGECAHFDSGIFVDESADGVFCTGNTMGKFQNGISGSCQKPDPDDNLVH